ncbi:uncharacterized protein G2W53_003879 [Senna tora]|uniref:Uncharacterized protein n=1 Tax=Senna tora TaxID=362788 RepID=A0A834XB37_9FABA|nr:uncharacterized protein G2W53_003879 [Senna tora]
MGLEVAWVMGVTVWWGMVEGLKGKVGRGGGYGGGWGLGFGLREGEWLEKGDGGLEGGWVNVVWWGCYGGVAMEVELVVKKKKRLERERGRFWGKRRERGC